MATQMNSSLTNGTRLNQIALGIGPLVVLGIVFYCAGWTGGNLGSSAVDAAWVLLHWIWLPALWFIAAIGLGWPLRRLLMPSRANGTTIQIGLGVGGMMFLDHLLGVFGILQSGNSVFAWALLCAGAVMLVVQVICRANRNAVAAPPAGLLWTTAPSIAILLLAACAAPGWLWSSEFGGYDALSYHLELPKEWLALGRIAPLHHNVYSYFPGYVESAYYHLAAVIGHGVEWAYAAQLLHAFMTLVTAGVICVAARNGAGAASHSKVISIVAAVAFLGTPWTIVAGSLAYNEMFSVFMLAVGCVLMWSNDLSPARRGVILGFISGAACGAKLTSLGLVAFPLSVAMFIAMKPSRWMVTMLIACGTGCIVLMPYFVRNTIDAGNPVFPFATGMFGVGHWTAEQARIFSHAHVSDAGIAPRLLQLWQQWFAYGIGPNPHSASGEPWQPQWSVLPWLGIAGLVLGAIRRESRRRSLQMLAMLFMQIVFWLTATHLQSRFLIPTLVPLCIGVAIGVQNVGHILQHHMRSMGLPMTTLAILCIAWCFVPVLIFYREPNHAPAAATGMIDKFTGESLEPAQREDMAATAFPDILINFVLPHNSRVLFVGNATPLYILDVHKVVYQTTWDRGLLSKIMHDDPDQPSAWINELQKQGFTHLRIDPNMLQRWERSGWNDQLLTANRVLDAAQHFTRLVKNYPNGELLFQIPSSNRSNAATQPQGE
jgi:hypothetical protein